MLSYNNITFIFLNIFIVLLEKVKTSGITHNPSQVISAAAPNCDVAIRICYSHETNALYRE